MSTLADRLRSIVSGAVPRVAPDARGAEEDAAVPIATYRGLDAASLARAAAVLGGSVSTLPNGATIVVDRFYEAGSQYGRVTIGDIADVLLDGEEALALLTSAWPASAPARDSFSASASARQARSAMLELTRLDGREAEGRDAPARSASSRTPCDSRVATGADCEAAAHAVDSRQAAQPLWFLDLETTGLAGGAGTQAFLVGCACLDRDGFSVRQFLLPGYEHERALLAEMSAWAAERGAIVTFNGRSFDVPLIETRYLFHRQPFPLEGRPHVDMLHPARRLWRARGEWEGASEASCSLGTLEKLIAGVHRVGDVPGFEIPSRYFRFVRDGDARPLEAVLEHNRLDLVSLALVMARALTLVERGPSAALSPYECLGLARIYDRAGRREEAEASYLQAIDRLGKVGRDPETLADALRRLAYCRRRAGRWRDAAEAWQQLADLPRCPAVLRHEAREALAIYHEHRARDLNTAHAHARQLFSNPVSGRQRDAAEHRLRRLERKLGRKTMGSSLFLEPIDDQA